MCSPLHSSLKSHLGWLHNLTFVESTKINMDMSRGFLQCQTHYCHMWNPSLIIPFHCPPKWNLLNSSENSILFPITDTNMKFFIGTKSDTTFTFILLLPPMSICSASETQSILQSSIQPFYVIGASFSESTLPLV